MKQYFKLDRNEQLQEISLLGFAILGFGVIGKGVYNQMNNVDQDYILIPLLFGIVACFCFVYAFNAFTKGHITSKWTPFHVYPALKFVYFKLLKVSKPEFLAKRTLGILSLLFGITFVGFMIQSLRVI